LLRVFIGLTALEARELHRGVKLTVKLVDNSGF